MAQGNPHPKPMPKGPNQKLAVQLNSPMHFKRVQRRELQDRALQLRMAGMSTPAIAAQLQVKTTNTVRTYLKAALKEMTEARIEKAEALADMEIARLDRLFAAVWPLALGRPADPTNGAKSVPPDVRAMDRCLAIIAQRCRILGIGGDGRPVPVTPVDKDGRPLEAQATVQNFNQVFFELPRNGTEPGHMIDVTPPAPGSNGANGGGNGQDHGSNGANGNGRAEY